VLRFIEMMAAKWNPSMIGIEQVQYQAAVVQELLRRTKLPIRGIRPDRDKVTRFAPLEARYEQSQVMHCQGLPAYFEDELLSFPVGRHDDVVDALAYAWQVCGSKRSWGAV
jgi:predicted phage terminase large subunit-like protein